MAISHASIGLAPNLGHWKRVSRYGVVWYRCHWYRKKLYRLSLFLFLFLSPTVSLHSCYWYCGVWSRTWKGSFLMPAIALLAHLTSTSLMCNIKDARSFPPASLCLWFPLPGIPCLLIFIGLVPPVIRVSNGTSRSQIAYHRGKGLATLHQVVPHSYSHSSPPLFLRTKIQLFTLLIHIYGLNLLLLTLVYKSRSMIPVRLLTTEFSGSCTQLNSKPKYPPIHY